MHYKTFMVLFGDINHRPCFLMQLAIDLLLSPSEGLHTGVHHSYVAYPFRQSLPFQPTYNLDTKMSGTRMSMQKNEAPGITDESFHTCMNKTPFPNFQNRDFSEFPAPVPR